MSKDTWKPHSSLTEAPTNLKEAIDWVLRVTGKDGKENKAAPKAQPPPPKPEPGPHCLCYLAKAVKDLLYDARSPGNPGPSTERYWDDILLGQEKDIAQPVLKDLGLLSTESTSATSTSTTCAGGTEVIKALIDQLAQGLQKWVGWQEGDTCCLGQTKGGKSDGIGKGCSRSGAGIGADNCCTTSGVSHSCTKCGTSGGMKCYLSAYCKENSTSSGSSGGGASTEGNYYWSAISSDSTKVHLLARIFLGSVCLIWSGLSQLGFLTKEGSKRWEDSKLHSLDDAANAGLGSFMAAMGYDLERLNQGGVPGGNKDGTFVWKLLSGTDPNGSKGIQWKEFTGDSANQNSVAEYYSSIYDKAKEALKNSNTESICKDYPLLVLHILASGYFRAGSAGAKGIKSPAKPATEKKETPSPRKPRTIREILYWLSALPYSEKYCQLVERMKEKCPKEGTISLEGINAASTTLLQKDITHYLMAACGYCPLVLIGIQGTIEKEVDKAPSAPSSAAAGDENKCKRKYDEKTSNDGCSKCPSEGKVCYRGYHLEVSKFGPLHGMYANGLFGFQMDLSAAQCLDQLRTYVYHCFYQLYFLRKQCSTGVVEKAVLGWQSCRYGSGVAKRANDRNTGTDTKNWMCKPLGNSNDNQGGSPNQNNGQKCNCLGEGATQGGHGSKDGSPLQSFLCDSITGMHCGRTIGATKNYPEIEDHINCPAGPASHFGGPPKHCPVPMGWSSESTSGSSSNNDNHFKDLKDTHKQADLDPAAGNTGKYPAHCTGRTLSYLLEYYCDPEQCPSGTLVVLLRLLACITPTVPRTLGDLFGFYYYIVYIGGQKSGGQKVYEKLTEFEKESKLHMPSIGGGPDAVVKALKKYGENCSGGTQGTLNCLYKCTKGAPTGQCSQYLSPLSGQQYGQLSPAMAGTYLSWLVYLIEGFKTGLEGLRDDYMKINCKESECNKGVGGAAGCGGGGQCQAGTHGTMCSTGGSQGVCQCTSVVSCTGVLPVLYKYGFGYGNVEALHDTAGGAGDSNKQCHHFLETLNGVLNGNHLKKEGATSGLYYEINQLIYTTRLPWIFVLTIAWLVAVLYLAFGAIWPLDWTHMRSHCRGWFRKGSLSPWEILMVGKKKGRGILEFFGKT